MYTVIMATEKKVKCLVVVSDGQEKTYLRVNAKTWLLQTDFYYSEQPMELVNEALTKTLEEAYIAHVNHPLNKSEIPNKPGKYKMTWKGHSEDVEVYLAPISGRLVFDASFLPFAESVDWLQFQDAIWEKK
jgi:hypothetical protein